MKNRVLVRLPWLAILLFLDLAIAPILIDREEIATEEVYESPNLVLEEVEPTINAMMNDFKEKYPNDNITYSPPYSFGWMLVNGTLRRYFAFWIYRTYSYPAPNNGLLFMCVGLNMVLLVIMSDPDEFFFPLPRGNDPRHNWFQGKQALPSEVTNTPETLVLFEYLFNEIKKREQILQSKAQNPLEISEGP